MSSEEDEDFMEPSSFKRVKKSSGGGETKGRKKKEPKASSKKPASSSPKRKTPKPKKESSKEEKKAEKKEKPAGRGKSLQAEFEKTDPKRSKSRKSASEREDNDSDDEEEKEVTESKADEQDDEEAPAPSENESQKEESTQEKVTNKKGPKIIKTKKGGGSKMEGYEEIYEYMSKQNRPYSLQNIFDNLHGKIKKGACQKALDALVSDGQLKAKEFGKAVVYLFNQDNIPSVDEKEMEKLKHLVNKRRKEVEELQADVKDMNNVLKDVSAQLTSEGIEAEIKKYTQLNKEFDEKLKVYESGNYPKISDEDILAIENKKKNFENEYKKRKKICKGIIDHIANMTEQKINEIYEMIGLENDE